MKLFDARSQNTTKIHQLNKRALQFNLEHSNWIGELSNWIRELSFNSSLNEFESSLIQLKRSVIELECSLIPSFFHIAGV